VAATSSTSSSRAVLGSFGAALAIFALLLASAARRAVAPLAKTGDHRIYSSEVRDDVNRRKPDLVLVGNSLLYENVDEPTLHAELSRLCGRDITPMIVGMGGSGAPWWYLILKNQLSDSAARGIPVGVFFLGAELTAVSLPPNEGGLWALKKTLRFDDDVFFEKTASRSMWDRMSFKTTVGRREAGRVLLAMFSRPFTLSEKEPADLIESRFRLRSMDERRLMKNELMKGLRPSVIGACRSAACFDKTLLPDLTAFASVFRLFFVEVHRRPPVDETAEDRAYRADLVSRLERDRVSRVALNERPELDDVSLYNVTNHLNQRGSVINSKLLAADIVRHGLLAPAPVADRGGK